MKDKKEKKTTLLYGIHAVKETVMQTPFRVEKLYIKKGMMSPALKRVIEAADGQKIPIHFVSLDELEHMTKGRAHQGVAALAGEFEYADFNSWLKCLQRRNTMSFIIALDQVKDPQNLGAVLRSAAFFGAGGVLLPKDNSAKLTESAVKVSAGGAALVPVVRVVNLSRALDALKEAGYWIVGADAKAEQSAFDADFNVPIVFVLGSEDKGLRDNIRKRCDYLVGLPGSGRLDSLNVSVAAGILMAEKNRQKR